MFAATTQQTIALIVFIAAGIGAALYLAGNIRKAKPEVGSEIELAANRKPYLDDEQLEGPRLERALLWGVLSLMVIGIGLPLYWLTEPTRQEGAVEYFDTRLAGKTYHHGQPVGGGALFAATDEGGFNCAGCHGGDAGIGGEVPYTITDPDGTLRQVQWKAPALNTATLKWTDDQLRDILVYGRPFSPMPAWGVEGGGPMNEQQIDNLIRYLHQIAREAGYENEDGTATPEAARELMAEEVIDEKAALLGLDDEIAELNAIIGDAEASESEKADAEAELEDLLAEIEDDASVEGEALFNLNCARCHTQGWSYDEPKESGGGGMGPPLYNVTDQFPNDEDHIDFVTNGRMRGERYGETGQFDGQMPYFLNVLTEEQIAAIVEYERELRQEESD